jgi:hypothetical protein
MVFAMLTGSVTVRSQQKSIDFSGKWELNKEMSDFGIGRDGKERKPRSSQMIVKQGEKDLEVTIVRKNREGKEQKDRLKYSLEGKKSKNKTDFGKQESTVKWLEGGQSLEINSISHVKRGDMEMDMEATQTWSLVEGRLIIETVRHTPRGDMETKAVYDRVKDAE